jgi:hypothetical protein
MATVAAERDRAGERGDRADDEEPDEILRERDQVLHGGELVGLEDRQPRQIRRQAIRSAGGQAGGRRDPRHEALDVELDRAVRRRPVLDDVEERGVRAPVGELPRPERRRRTEDAGRVAHRHLAQPRGGGRRERVEARRERVAQALLDGVRVVQPVDQRDRERGADLVVLEELRARGHPVVRVERLPLRPDAEDGRRPQQRPDDEERRRPDPLR